MKADCKYLPMFGVVILRGDSMVTRASKYVITVMTRTDLKTIEWSHQPPL